MLWKFLKWKKPAKKSASEIEARAAAYDDHLKRSQQKARESLQSLDRLLTGTLERDKADDR